MKKVVSLLLAFVLLMSFAGRDEEVADPWYTGDFAGVYKQIEEGCRAVLNLTK